MANTANYGWPKPTVGGDVGSWGTIANTLFDSVDTEVKNRQNEAAAAQTTANAATTTASAALPKAGGTMTGEIKIVDIAWVKASFTGQGVKTLDLNAANYFQIDTTTGNLTIAFTNVPSGTFASCFILRITTAGAHTVTWPASVKWPGGVAAVQTASGTDLYAGVTDDGGTTWRVVRVGRAMA